VEDGILILLGMVLGIWAILAQERRGAGATTRASEDP